LGQAAQKLLILIVAVLLPFAALLLFMIPSQADLLFPIHAVAPAGPLPPGAEHWEVESPDGERLHGVHFPPESSGAPRKLILGFGGNAWNGQHVAEYLHQLFPEADVVAFHYRGYRPSTGKPSSVALMDDASLLFDEAVKRLRPEQVVVVGFSIGTGVAARLSRKRSPDGLILVTPFDSLKAAAQDMYPMLPVGLFFDQEMPTGEDLSGGTVPVAILAAERDEIIGSRRTDSLRKRVPNLLFDRTIAGAGHNDIYYRPEFRAAMTEALQAVASK
jgi:pimeloyl-ACP methyl ester carboxylesterase